METPENEPGRGNPLTGAPSQPGSPSQDDEQRRRDAQPKPGEQRPGKEDQDPDRKPANEPDSGDEDETTPGA